MCYFDNATSRTRLTVEAICHELKNPKFGEVELVVGIGFSGTLLLTAIHIQSGIPFGAIRKDKSSTHSSRSVETGGIRYIKGNERYVIIDDFTESGDTIDRIKMAMSPYRGPGYPSASCECAGIILYQETKFVRGDTLKNHPDIPLSCLACDIEEVAMVMRTEKETCGV